MNTHFVSGKLVDIPQQSIYSARIKIVNDRIAAIEKLPSSVDDASMPYIMPGFIDAHVHIESSMLVPSQFAKLAVVHGTVATVSDPHEIANVCGITGVEFMIADGNKVPFKFFFGAPSCVPATVFETAGASLTATEVDSLLARDDIRYLSEMMNFPGVLHGDAEVMKKIQSAHKRGKPVDGHAPGLRGEDAARYIAAGIGTDHECFTAEEALDKLSKGMKIIIREGSAARNFEALIGLLRDFPDRMMFCSDDKHPDSLVAGHINELCARAIKKGIPLFNVLKAACCNPVVHYNLPVGQLREGDAADFILVKDLDYFETLQTYINGKLVAENGHSQIQTGYAGELNHFDIGPINAIDIKAKPWPDSSALLPVIGALDGQLITEKNRYKPLLIDNVPVSDINRDILKMVVVNRYRPSLPAIAFVQNFGLKQGAIASSVAHDSHNIIAVGVDDESIATAINAVIGKKGGISCVGPETELVLALPVAGLMSADDGYRVAEAYTALDGMAKQLGSTLSAPFMTLSFMALLVIPHLKLSDLGLFDGDRFELDNGC